MPELNIPNPLIFGSAFPQLRIRFEYGKQYVYSASNLNLYIDDSDLLSEGRFEGTYPIGELLDDWRGFLPDQTPGFVHQDNLTLPPCPVPCRMMVKSWEEREFKRDDSDEPFNVSTVELWDTPQLHECPVITALLSSLSTPAEIKFAEAYYTWAFVGAVPVMQDGLRQLQYATLPRRYGSFLRQWKEQQLRLQGSYRSPGTVINKLLKCMSAPALIPQVWLNYTYDPKRAPDEVKADLQGMPRRVDFLYIKNRKLHVIEIDGPSGHYATFDEKTKTYKVDERLYTDNLKVERSLRKQGIEIHRFSNWEILNASESEMLELIADVLGLGEDQHVPNQLWHNRLPDIPGLKLAPNTFFSLR